MKLILGLIFCSNVLFASSNFSQKNPNEFDISINLIVDHTCEKSGDFNPATCFNIVNRCYTKTNWPKTITAKYKLDAVFFCLDKYIR
jgi:hypothetical protein